MAGIGAGRPRELNYERIEHLRAEGWKLREIAAEMGCSISAIGYALLALAASDRNPSKEER